MKSFRILLSDRNSIIICADRYYHEAGETRLVFLQVIKGKPVDKRVATFYTSNILGFEELGEETSNA